MKEFVKMTLSVLCAFFVVGILLFLLTIGAIGSMAIAGSAESQVSLPKSGVLVMDFSKMNITEQTLPDNPLSMFQNGTEVKENVGILDAVRAIETASTDPSIKYIYLRPEGVTSEMSNCEEIRAALEKCHEAGKPIIAYMTGITTASYYLGSVADKVYSTSYLGATNMFNGIGGSLYFLKDLLDRLGINMQLIRHGKYKSAGEMFIRNSASEENLDQNKAMISSMWHSYASAMAESRGLSEAQLNSLVESLALNSNEDFLEAGLIDELFTREELKDKLTTLAVEEKYSDVNFISFPDYARAKVTNNTKAKKKITVIYAEGEIVDGDMSQDVAGERFARIIASVRQDSSVAAVVLRVNSPGGSVLASERILAELQLLKKDKPLIASYGSYAASGGYWISSSCDKIYSDETTLTGSIGVFSMIPDFSGTLRNIAHVTMTSVNSNEHADIFSCMRPLDSEETAYLQCSVESIYERFVSIVSEGRSLDSDFVDSIAQGRVWTGAEALGIGLVDEIGTLDDALRYAAVLAAGEGESSDISNYNIESLPRPATGLESVMEMFLQKSGGEFDGSPLGTVAKTFESWKSDFNAGKRDIYFARMPFELVIGQ